MAIDERRGALAETGWESPDPTDDARLIAALRRGDDAAFVTLVDRYHATLVRLAAMYVRDRAVVDEVVQETWLGVLRGIDRFEERSSLRTWMFRILTNQAKHHAVREGRTIPFASLARANADEDVPAVEPDRFLPPGHEWGGHWGAPPQRWDEMPEDCCLSGEALGAIHQAIRDLSPGQREVVSLRDVEGWTAEEVCNALGLSETNQRVLLHRARANVRRALARHFEG